MGIIDVAILNSILSTLYKIASLFSGVAFAYMGYRLFRKGIWGDAGSFKINADNTKIVLKNAAPGTFYALFGAGIIIAVVSENLNLGISSKSTSNSEKIDETISETITEKRNLDRWD